MTKTQTLTKILEALRYDTTYGQDAATWWLAEYGPITDQDVRDLDGEMEGYGDTLIARLAAEGVTDINPARDWEKVGDIANLVALGR